MISLFYGDDRIKAQMEIHKVLGDKYEVIDGEEITPETLPNIFWGSSLFTQKRSILIKDLSKNKDVWPLPVQYFKTEHNIVLWEHSIRKNTKIYKELQKAKVALREFKSPPSPDVDLVFNIFTTAWRDGPKAVEMLGKIENTQDPQRFMGLMTTQALKKYEYDTTGKARSVLKELAQLDIQLKTTKFSSEPWSLIEAFLLRLQDIK